MIIVQPNLGFGEFNTFEYEHIQRLLCAASRSLWFTEHSVQSWTSCFNDKLKNFCLVVVILLDEARHQIKT